jgi:hypothetical protein
MFGAREASQMGRWVIVGAAALALASASAAAAEDALPPVESVTLPPITYGTDPKVAANGYKFFFFHNAALTYAEAAADLADCHAQLATGATLLLPAFVPWTEQNLRPIERGFSPYGLAGEAILAIIGPKLERGQRNNRMRLCMERRGYVRYAIDQAAYDAIWEGEPARVLAMQAKLATGPAPAAPVVTE